MGPEISSGCWPTMITPYTRNGEVDFDGVYRLVEYFITSGCAGIFAVCKSSEMFELSLDERVALGKAVVEAVRGRIGVIVSGHISDSREAQVDELCAMAETGTQALVLVTNRMGRESEEEWIERTASLISRLPKIPLGLYECPYPFPMLMTEAMLKYCSESDRFYFIKDTCCDEARITKRLAQLKGSQVKLFNANSATLLDSLLQGAAGFCGVMGNFHADLYSWLCANPTNERAQALSALLSHLSNVEEHGYPINAKYHGQFIGVPMEVYTRQAVHKRFDETHKLQIRQMVQLESLAREYIGISSK